MANATPHCVGEHYRDICRVPGCDVCAIWPRPGETDREWKDRLAAMYRIAVREYRLNIAVREGAA